MATGRIPTNAPRTAWDQRLAGRDGWRWHRYGNLMLERCPGIGDEIHPVRLSKDPRKRQADPYGITSCNRSLWCLLEFPIGVVDLDLGDCHRFRTTRADEQLQSVVIEYGPLDGQVFDRRRAIVETLERVRLK